MEILNIRVTTIDNLSLFSEVNEQETWICVDMSCVKYIVTLVQFFIYYNIRQADVDVRIDLRALDLS
jgi:hypothetical protein